MSEKKRTITRTRSKIELLPPETKLIAESMLANVSYTYEDISEYLKEQGYDISRAAVGRYAIKTNNATKRVLEAQAQVAAIVEAVKKNPDLDYTEGTMQMIAGGLTQRIAAAQEEWDEMDLNKAVSSLIALSRAKGYKDKVYSELSKKLDLALNGFKQQIFEEISDKDPRLAERLIFFAEDFAERITQEK